MQQFENVANLIIDIGNTALKAAWCEGITLGKTFRYQGEKMSDFILSLVSRNKPDVMVISSVREISAGQEELFRKECGRLLILAPGRDSGILSESFPSYLSPDRAASIVAAGYLFKGRRCTVVDLGTTLTIDIIDSDGTYERGFISPGCRTRFKALNRYTKSLPLLDTPEDYDENPAGLVLSMEAGVIKGIIFEIQGYLSQFPDNIVVFTGGDANYFAKRLKKPIFVVCNLVLMGLALMAENYVEKYL